MTNRVEENIIQYRVSLGHASVDVAGQNKEEAIANARRRLCQELPRLWDVISRTDAEKFEVTDITGE